MAQVGYLEVVDAMVGQLVKQLWQAETEGRGPFTICITGDHSTPVEYGDHSHEPVPLAIAQIRFACPFVHRYAVLLRSPALVTDVDVLPGMWWTS